jgi:hypothetical protein
LSLKWIIFHTGIAGVSSRVHGAANFIIQVGKKNQYSALGRFLVIEQQKISIKDSLISKFGIVFAKIMYVPKKLF